MLLENVHTRGAPGINLLQTQESIVHCYTAPMITNAASDHSQHYVLLVSCYAMHKLSSACTTWQTMLLCQHMINMHQM